MKTIVIALVGIIGLVNAAAILKSNTGDWAEFKLKYGKVYKNEIEEEFRQKIFRNNLYNITKHNKNFDNGLVTFKMGINQFSDLLQHEFAATHSNFKMSEQQGLQFVSSNPKDLPKSIDWRQKGAVTEVKDQKDCGSCWAFSTTGSVEGQHFLKTGKLVSLSEQNLIDCSLDRYQDYGCIGGVITSTFQFIIDNGGIDTEASYPYGNTDSEKCRYNVTNSGATISSFVRLPHGDEEKLKEAVALVGPISVAIDSSSETFRHYQSGVYVAKDCSSDALDHGVLVVGYGTDEAGVDYWIVKNSLNAGWGESGYIRMARNQNNHCGIATRASYPVV